MSRIAISRQKIVYIDNKYCYYRRSKAPGSICSTPISRKIEPSPFNPVLAALEAVTLVTWFEEETPLRLILAVKPHVLVKCGDWKPEAIVGASEVKSWGGAVYSIPLLPGHSTTSVIERIRRKS